MDFLITLAAMLLLIVVVSILLGHWSDRKAAKYLQEERKAQQAYNRQHQNKGS